MTAALEQWIQEYGYGMTWFNKLNSDNSAR